MLQVRCAAVFALGTFVGNSAERTDHSTTIDHNVAMMLAQLINDGSPVVRKVLLLLLLLLVLVLVLMRSPVRLKLRGEVQLHLKHLFSCVIKVSSTK